VSNTNNIAIRGTQKPLFHTSMLLLSWSFRLSAVREGKRWFICFQSGVSVYGDASGDTFPLLTTAKMVWGRYR